MKLNDIRTDLDSKINIVSGYEKKDLKISELTKNNTSDIFNDSKIIKKDINLSHNNKIKILNKKRKYIFFKHKSFDTIIWINKNQDKDKDINISKSYNWVFSKYLLNYIKLYLINLINYLKNDIKNSYNNFIISSQEFYINNIKKNKKEFKNKKIKIKKKKSLLFRFICISILFLFWMLIIKLTIQTSVNHWYEKLISIKDWSWNFKSIQKTINDAKFSFIFSDILFSPLSIIPNESINNAYHVIKWWKKITALWDQWLHFLEWIQTLIKNKWINNIYISQFLDNNKVEFLNLEVLLSESLIHYDKITNIWNTKLEATFNNTINKLHKLLGYIKTINLNFEEFLSLMWHEEVREYLIVFQNNDEIRPTGWFMWSMWIMSIYKWKVIEIKKSDVYAYEWEINKQYELNNIEKELAPEWLDQITWTWWLRDSNYEPVIKDTAADIKWFLDTINVNIDGIIFINKSTIEEILKVSGWIEFDQLEEKITHENFSRIISTLVEAKVSKIWTLWTPKQILFDFAEIFYNYMKKNNDYLPYAKVIFNHLNSRDIIIYSFHPEENSLLWKLDINWELAFHKTLDFSYPVFTSLSWNKSDRYIKTQFNKITEEIWKCSYKTNLEIIRKHQYNNIEEEKVDILLDKYNIEDKEHIRYIQWKWDNYQYVRIFLPKNASINKQEWLVVTDYQRYKIAEFYIKTRLYETTSNTIEYTIDKSNCNGYSYKLYKQPGINSYDINISINWEKISSKNLNKDFIINR